VPGDSGGYVAEQSPDGQGLTWPRQKHSRGAHHWGSRTLLRGAPSLCSERVRPNVDVHMALGETAVRVACVEAILTELRMAVEQGPDDVPAWLGLRSTGGQDGRRSAAAAQRHTALHHSGDGEYGQALSLWLGGRPEDVDPTTEGIRVGNPVGRPPGKTMHEHIHRAWHRVRFQVLPAPCASPVVPFPLMTPVYPGVCRYGLTGWTATHYRTGRGVRGVARGWVWMLPGAGRKSLALDRMCSTDLSKLRKKRICGLGGLVLHDSLGGGGIGNGAIGGSIGIFIARLTGGAMKDRAGDYSGCHSEGTRLAA
jgi:hypothetical protein